MRWWQLTLLPCFFQILCYYNPSFTRQHPQLLGKCKRRVDIKRRAPEAPQREERPPSRSPDSQPAGDTQASPPTKRRAEAPPGLGSACPSPPAAAPTLPEPAGAAGSQSFILLALFLLLLASNQSPEGLQHPAPAPPQLAVPALAAAPALPRPRPPHGQSPTVPHCPTCTCSPSPADGPQCGTS